MVLTAEVAQRHDQIVALRDEIKTHEQQEHEMQMQLQLKSEVIKELRREIRILKEGQSLAGLDKVSCFGVEYALEDQLHCQLKVFNSLRIYEV